MARHFLCLTRLRSVAAGGDTVLPPLRERPTLCCAVPEAQRAAAVGLHQAMSERNFFAELKRRNVYKVAVAYAVVAWLLMQIASQIFPFFEIPNWAVRFVVLAIVIGFPIALILAWAFELTPEGIKRTEVADATHQRSHGAAWIYIAVIGVVL